MVIGPDGYVSTASLRTLYEQSPIGIVLTDMDGTILAANPAAASLTGHRPDEMIGRHAVELVEADGRPTVEEHLRRLGTGQESPLYFRRRYARPGGPPVWADCWVSVVRDPDRDAPYLQVVTLDVSRRELAEDRLEVLLDGSPDAMMCVRPDGIIVAANHQCLRVFGYNREELIGRSIDVLVPEDVMPRHPELRARYAARPSTRLIGDQRRLSARRRDGSLFPVEVSLATLETSDAPLVVAAVRDVTERRRLEGEKAQLRAELKRAQVEEERAVLQAQLHQSQRLESIGQLAGGIAHDFNNLLAGIMNYATLVASGLAELTARLGLGDDPAVALVAEDVAQITKVAMRAAQVTRQLLIFSRRERVSPEVVDLNASVTEMESLLRRMIRESVQLSTALAPDLPNIRIDPGQLEQVIMNLAVNARDAMAESGGFLRITTDLFEVDDEMGTRRAPRSGSYVRLSVSDTGRGMSPEVRERAFEPFFTTKPKGEGTGLGLATVYGIVTEANGDVMIYSEPGVGTTVRILLPGTNQAVGTPAAAASHHSSSGGGRTILLVEDEEMVREPARRMLTRYGFEVLPAPDAARALDLVRRDPGLVDLVLTDVIMPGGSGKAMVQTLREMGVTAPVLYMSGYTHDVIVHHGVLEEGVRLLEKPFTSEGLVAAVCEVLEIEGGYDIGSGGR